MLNELKLMLDGLENAKIPLKKAHPFLVKPGGKKGLRVVLNEQGYIDEIEYLDKEKLENVWEISPDNKNRFPNTTNPKNYLDGLKKSKFGELISNIAKNIPEIAELLRRLELFKLENLEQKMDEIRTNHPDKRAVKSLEKKLKHGKEKNDKPLYIFDFKPKKEVDTFSTDFRTYASKLIEILNKLDLEKFDIYESNKNNFFCAVTGVEYNLIEDKFYRTRLGKGKSVSTITHFFKYDKNGSFKTVERYRKSGVDSFTINRELGKKIHSVLVHLAEGIESRGKTWDQIPSERADEKDLMIAYCHGNFDVSVLSMVGSASEIEDQDDYESRTKEVLELWEKGNLNPDALADFFVFRKINDGNQKIIYSTSQSISRLKQAADYWIESCKNVPSLKLKIQIGKQKEIKFFNPWSISPADVIKLSAKLFYSNKINKKQEIPSIAFAEIMRLFLRQPPDSERFIQSILSRIVSQAEPWFRFSGQTKLLDYAFLKKGNGLNIDYIKNRETHEFTTLIGLLLYRIKQTKEIYMNQFSYQLGQLCCAMDELHIGYCVDIRNGEIPNTLVGNATYAIALNSPSRALGLLALRIKPYEAWANKKFAKTKLSNDLKEPSESTFLAEKEKIVENAIFAHRWIKQHAESLHSIFSSTSKDLILHKAELMLGYLAGRPFNVKETKLSTIEQTNEEKYHD